LLNNNGYLIERLLCKNPAMAYNDLASWEYSKLPEALGCKGWFTARVSTCGELDQALKAAEQDGVTYWLRVINIFPQKRVTIAVRSPATNVVSLAA
jgi:indolepyruvate decarboxylase